VHPSLAKRTALLGNALKVRCLLHAACSALHRYVLLQSSVKRIAGHTDCKDNAAKSSLAAEGFVPYKTAAPQPELLVRHLLHGQRTSRVNPQHTYHPTL
jgi:hypothetical protein